MVWWIAPTGRDVMWNGREERETGGKVEMMMMKNDGDGWRVGVGVEYRLTKTQP